MKVGNMKTTEALRKQIFSLEGLEALYHSEGKIDVAMSFNQQIQVLNGELMRMSIVEKLTPRNLNWE